MAADALGGAFDLSSPEVLIELQESVDSVVGLFTQFALTLVTGVGALAFFAIMRTRNQIVYNPRTFFSKDKHYVPPKLNASIFGWLPDLLKGGVQGVSLYAGIDAAIYLTFLKTMVKIFALASIPGIGLIGLHYWGNYSTKQESSFTLVGASSLSMVARPSFYWIHTVCIYFFTAVIIWYVRQMWLSYIHIRQSLWFRSPMYTKPTHAKTIMVTDVPKTKALNGSDAALAEWLVGRGISKFRHALWGRDVHDLDTLITKREAALKKLEAAMVHHYKNVSPSEARQQRELPHDILKKVHEVKDMEARIQHIREEATPETFKALAGGFATFTCVEDAHEVARAWYHSRINKGVSGVVNMTARGATTAAGAVGNVATRAVGGGGNSPTEEAKRKQLKIKSDFRLRMAPNPKHVIWPNLALTPATRKLLRRRGRFYLFLLGALWVIPVTVLTILTQLDMLLLIMPVEVREWFRTNPELKSIIDSVLGPLVFTIFLAILPSIVRSITRGQRAVVSEAQGIKLNMGKIYYFYIAGFFTVFSLMSSLVGLVGALIDVIEKGEFTLEWVTSQGVGFVQLIPATFIRRGGWWINYVSLNGPGALPVELAQIVRLGARWVRSLFSTLTPREELEVTRPPPFEYDIQYGYSVFIATLGFVYFAHHPLILVLIAIYFAVAFIVYKYQVSYSNGFACLGDEHVTKRARFLV